MPCYHPLTAVKLAEKNENGKHIIKILPGSVVNPVLRPGEIEVLKLPCGQCIGCRLDYSREWANRLVLEAKQWKYNYMITLTYDDEHISYFNSSVLPTLVPKDLTKFVKDLRSHFKYDYGEDNIRFYGCGEYGESSGRPHYHIIVFNCNIRDLVPVANNFQGDVYYASDYIEDIWHQGNIQVTDFNWNVAAYVARYVTKKWKGPGAKAYYDDLGIVPEFVRMSRKPGLARAYYDEHKDDMYKFDNIYIPKPNGIIEAKPCTYYDKLYDLENPEKLDLIKRKRRAVAIACDVKGRENTSLDYFQYNAVRERNKYNSQKALKRN